MGHYGWFDDGFVARVLVVVEVCPGAIGGEVCITWGAVYGDACLGGGLVCGCRINWMDDLICLEIGRGRSRLGEGFKLAWSCAGGRWEENVICYAGRV